LDCFFVSFSAQQTWVDICFPADASLHFNSEESRAANELQCPLHGPRIPAGKYPFYRPKWLGNDRDNGWSWHSVQYRRAMVATYDYLEGRL
jgi:hypothetical protein